MQYLKVINVLLIFALTFFLLNSCREDNPVEPQEHWPAGAGAVLFVKPDDAVTKVPYGKTDTLQWRVCPDSVVRHVVIQIQEKGKNWKNLLHVSAVPNFRTYPVLYEIGTEIRFRIKSEFTNEWDSTQYLTVYEGMELVFPGSNATLYSGLTVKIRYRNPSDRPFTIYYTRDDRKEQWTRLMSSSDPMFWSIDDTLVSEQRYYLKMVDDLDGRSRVGSGFMIKQGPDPGFHIIAPESGAKYLSGEELEVTYISDRGVVAFDLSTNGGKTWKEIISDGAEPKWNVAVGKLVTNSLLRMRTVDTSFSVTSQPFTLDPHKLQFRILRPRRGDVILPGDYFTVEFENSQGEEVTFSLSLDDGKTWEPIRFDRITRLPNGCDVMDTTYKWFVVQDPTPACRLKMASKDGFRVATTGRFSIDDQLADFIPFRPGKVFVYTHSWGETGNQRINVHRVVRTIEVQREWSNPDFRYYQCKVTDVDDSGNVILVYTDTVAEELSGLHRLYSPPAPLQTGLPRYYSSRIDEVTRGINCYLAIHYFTLRKETGLTIVTNSSRSGMYQWSFNTWALRK
ncbi:MAG: hypothetical protein GXO82_01630 [Chlorobi bacterium]|nr:hypothetical protein [Chlorobiota bacterium]